MTSFPAICLAIAAYCLVSLQHVTLYFFQKFRILRRYSLVCFRLVCQSMNIFYRSEILTLALNQALGNPTYLRCVRVYLQHIMYVYAYAVSHYQAVESYTDVFFQACVLCVYL